MTRRTRIALLITSHVLVAAASAAAAVWYLERRLAVTNAMANHMALIARHSAMLDLQRREGGRDEYRDALLAFSAALDEARDPNNPLFDERAYRADKTLVAVRLSRVERDAGNDRLADQYMKMAISTCVAIPWKDCDGAHLISVSERLDRHGFFEDAGAK